MFFDEDLRSYAKNIDALIETEGYDEFWVRTSKADQRILETTIRHWIEDAEIIDGKLDISPWQGGLWLMIGDQTIEPQCCSDLSNLENWENLLRKKNKEWDELWIGHPWVFCRFVGDKLHISDYTDTNLCQMNDFEGKIVLDSKELESNLKSALIEYERFLEKLKNCVSSSFPDHSDYMALSLTTLNTEQGV